MSKMEVSLQVKEEVRKTQSDLKKALQLHQIWVGRLKDDENSVEIKMKIKQAESNIVSIGQMQKKVIERIRHELMLHHDRLKSRNKLINSEYDHRHIALQLREHQLQHRTKKKSISLLKPSVLNEMHVKTEGFDGDKTKAIDYEHNGAFIKQDEDDSDFIHATENFSLKDTPISRNSLQERRTNLSNTLKKVKQNICSSIEISIKPSPSPKSLSSKSSSTSPVGEEISPIPSPPLELPLPQPGDRLTQETFLRVIGLITPRQRNILEKKRNERKKRSTTSTNKNEYVYGNFDLKRKKLNFPYLQQNVPPPQTRSQKMRRQQLASRRTATNLSPVASPSTSPPLQWPNSLTLPSGLTIQAVPSPGVKQCTVCRQSDNSGSLLKCPRCKNCFHASCSSSPNSRSPSSRSRSPINNVDRRYRRQINTCPECGEEIKEPKFSSWTVISKGYSNNPTSEERLTKEKIIEKKILNEKNKQLNNDLRKLEIRAETLKENIEASNIEKKQLISNQNNTRKRIKKLLDFVSNFKDAPTNLCLVVDKDSSRNTNDTVETDPY